MSKTTTVQLDTVIAGERFVYGGLEFVVLEHTAYGTVAIAANCVCARPFDNWNSGNETHNDWGTSTLKKWLNDEFLKVLLQEGATESAFSPMIFDLTAKDGSDEYETDGSKVGLLDVGNYMEYRRLLPCVYIKWWLIAPNSTETSDHSYNARSVDPIGTLNATSPCFSSVGVRPLCTLQSSTLVSKTEETENE
ncbi:MAG: DUF6273 domain-containing protein [Oscillospiraceae bacterium]